MKQIVLILWMLLLAQSNSAGQVTDSIAVLSPEAITAKMLDYISCEKGSTIDWESFRQLFLPTAQFISMRTNASGQSMVEAKNLEQFIRDVGPMYTKYGFEEKVIGLEVQQFNDIANVFQSFHCYTPDKAYEAKGINSYQLVYSSQRWWISNLMFTNASEESEIPDTYLFEEKKSKK